MSLRPSRLPGSRSWAGLNASSCSGDMYTRLPPKNARGLTPSSLEQWPTLKSASRGAPSSNSDTTAVREWAKANGYKVGDKGRIAADVRAAYAVAHP